MLGGSGAGTFTQSGGTNSGAEVYIGIGGNSGGPGIYNLSGGQLGTGIYPYEYVGYSTSGTLNQSGGINTTNTIYVGYSSLRSAFSQSGGTTTATSAIYLYNGGTYSLSGTGVLFAGGEYADGSCTFQQSGGTNNVGSTGLCLGYNAGAGSTTSTAGYSSSRR